MKSNWKLKELDNNIISKFTNVFEIDNYLSSILYAKGIVNLIDAYFFLNPKLFTLFSPFMMKGMSDAVNRIRCAFNNREKIGIFSDSDLDGLTSLTILLSLFNRIGIETYYRYPVGKENYGLSLEIIDELNKNDVSLLITLDSGIRDVKEIAYARELGVDVIVCDHHEPGELLPNAIVVNPKQKDCGYPFKELAGVGVTFKLCYGILMSYFKTFNKTFLLITIDIDGVYLLYIRNGIIERECTLIDIFQLKDYVNKIDKEEFVILYELGDDEEFVKSLLKNKNVYNLNSLFKEFSDCETTDSILSDKYLQKIYNKNRDILDMAFLEIEFKLSTKIRGFVDSVIDLVSIGTIADIMPIYGENRTIVFYGLKSINSTNHSGLSMLLSDMKKNIKSKNMAWDIAPLLNSPGRFGRTDLTARFFLEKGTHNLRSILNDINKINDERKRIIFQIYYNILNEIQDGTIKVGDNLLFIQSDKIPEGLSGLIANQLIKVINRPVIIVSLYNNKREVKGSGRSAGNFNFFSFVEPLSGMFEKIGGHAHAFGFTALIENVETIKERIEEAIGNNFIEVNEYNIDLEIPIDIIDLDFINNLSIFEPYGHKNEEPIFFSKGVTLKGFIRFGEKKNHGKYTFEENPFIEGIGWNMADIMEIYFGKGKINIIYRLENSEFNYIISPRMIILDID